MADYPSYNELPLFIPYSSHYFGFNEHGAFTGPTGGNQTWGNANEALYIPFNLPWPYPVARLFWANGTSNTQNVDIGIFTLDGIKLASSGSTGKSGASQLQYVSIPILLSAGSYYLAIVCNGSTASEFFGFSTNQQPIRALGWLRQATAFPLPATATFAAHTGTINMPVYGLTRTTSGF